MAGNAHTGSDFRLNVRLSSEAKKTIERAATELGLTVREFSVWALVGRARQVIRHHDAARLATPQRRRPVAPAARKPAAKSRSRRT